MTDLTVPQTILAQLGGESFVMTSGATGLVGSADSLTIKLGRNPKRVTHVRVTVTHDGLCDMTFFTIGKGPQSMTASIARCCKKSSAPMSGSLGPCEHLPKSIPSAVSSGALCTDHLSFPEIASERIRAILEPIREGS
jgi:hypothetical protein